MYTGGAHFELFSREVDPSVCRLTGGELQVSGAGVSIRLAEGLKQKPR